MAVALKSKRLQVQVRGGEGSLPCKKEGEVLIEILKRTFTLEIPRPCFVGMA